MASSHLFPGRHTQPKVPSSKRDQMVEVRIALYFQKAAALEARSDDRTQRPNGNDAPSLDI